MKIEEIAQNFKLKGNIVEIKENNTGNINKTYIITTKYKEKNHKYVLQKINTTVFNEPYLLMQNIENVTEYYKKYLEQNNEDVERGTLSVIRTNNNTNLYRTNNDEYYRMYNYIENAKTYDKSENAEIFYNVGKAFGHFVKILDNYPMDKLNETIPNFHNSKARLNEFLKDIKKDPCNRVKDVLSEIAYIIQRQDELNTIVDLIKKGEIPERVTHNDTKINNVLIDEKTNKAICVIDLDTVMPGSALYDFGDAIRSGAATTFEDDPNLDNVGINMEYFKKFTEAYLSETKEILTKSEIENLALSCRIMTLELAMRFLNDYINGDTYFKCNYEGHNLVRAKNQIKLVEQMEKNYEEMVEIVKNCTTSKTLKLDKNKKL